jgi:hypothetical protein
MASNGGYGRRKSPHESPHYRASNSRIVPVAPSRQFPARETFHRFPSDSRDADANAADAHPSPDVRRPERPRFAKPKGVILVGFVLSRCVSQKQPMRRMFKSPAALRNVLSHRVRCQFRCQFPLAWFTNRRGIFLWRTTPNAKNAGRDCVVQVARSIIPAPSFCTLPTA